MKSKVKKLGFTIVELLTVMSIIVILLSLLLPSLASVRRYARKVRQKGQFHEIAKCLEMFRIQYDTYPDSSPFDLGGESYCGAMKLCEAVMGQDGLGFHPDSMFDDMGRDKSNNELYYNRTTDKPTPPYSDEEEENLRSRRPPCLEEAAKVVPIQALLGGLGFGNVANFDPCCPVLCDVFARTELTDQGGERVGMPVLYYKADPAKLTHDANEAATSTNIYSYTDNQEIVQIQVPWAAATDQYRHPVYDSSGRSVLFRKVTKDPDVDVVTKPENPDTYILMSAGWDGLYGTRDDVFNFGR
ncbi:MAG: prepilin-type N-terminal cleavage/methylation domain-containing protein [Planctomycetota bacterium]|nr:MAG: prepilin-type N-terminal cleavage/methylation domain-containing protein [Planctomycetota bacterium]